MAVQSQTLAYDTSQLMGVIDDQAHQTNETNTLLIVSLITAFGALLATIYFILFRKTLKSVSDLQTGINKIGSGDLDYVIVTKKNDEISELSQAFNEMTAKLKAVTASKSDLEEVQKKLEEYANQMEELAEQRARQLQNSERLAAIGATAGMVGHDIRNPLQAIVSDIYLARQELKDTPEGEFKEGIKESLNSIENNVFYINKIVADLQDYAKPLNPQIQKTDIKPIIEQALSNSSIPKNIKTQYEIASNAQTVLADPDFLKRIMVNLTLNAIQAMPNGGKLTILAFREKQTGDINLTVKDTGVGIPDDVKSKLFTPMFTTKPKGQGFGLAVIKRLTERLGGTVTFESQTSMGTTFIVRLPAPKSKT
jgi:signal transduction histidine kinase